MIYYGDTANPPPFKRLLPGGIGYTSPCGTLVHYGHAPTVEQIKARILLEWERSQKQPAAPTPTKAPAWPVPKPPAYPSIPPSNRKFHCRACGTLTHLCNRHHPMPQEIKRSRSTVRLCFECHAFIHTLPNKTLAVMSWSEQAAYIQNVMLLCYA